jgi:hypothetical protein
VNQFENGAKRIVHEDIKAKFVTPGDWEYVQTIEKEALRRNEEHVKNKGELNFDKGLDNNPGIKYLVVEEGIVQLVDWFRLQGGDRLASLYRPDIARINGEEVSPKLRAFFSNQYIGVGLQERAELQQNLTYGTILNAAKNGRERPFKILTTACGDGYYAAQTVALAQKEGMDVQIDFIDSDPYSLKQVEKLIPELGLKNANVMFGDVINNDGIFLEQNSVRRFLDKKYDLIDSYGFAGNYLPNDDFERVTGAATSFENDKSAAVRKAGLSRFAANIAWKNLEKDGTLIVDGINDIPFMHYVLNMLVLWRGLIPSSENGENGTRAIVSAVVKSDAPLEHVATHDTNGGVFSVYEFKKL